MSLNDHQELKWFRISQVLAAASLLIAISVVEPAILVEWKYKLLSWLLAVGCGYLLIGEYVDFSKQRALWSDLGRAALISSGMTLIVLPRGSGVSAVLLSLLILVMSASVRRLFHRNVSWIVACLAFGISTLALETILTIRAPLETETWGELPALEQHATRVYGLKPDRQTRLRYNNYDYTLSVNSLGLPGPDIPAKIPGEFRILVVGDAFTMPEGVPYDQCYVSLLQDEFDQSSVAVRVINAGVTGYGPNESVPETEELVPLLDADLVIYQFFVNEFLEINLDAETRLKSIGLIDQPLDLRTLYVQRSQVMHRLDLGKGRFMEIISGRSPAWKYGKSLLQFYDQQDRSMYVPDTVGRLRSALQRMRDAANGNMVILFTPSAVEVTDRSTLSYFPKMTDEDFYEAYDMSLPFEALASVAKELGIPVMDPRAALAETKGNYFSESWHWTAAGHRVIADFIFSYLDANRGIPK